MIIGTPAADEMRVPLGFTCALPEILTFPTKEANEQPLTDTDTSPPVAITVTLFSEAESVRPERKIFPLPTSLEFPTELESEFPAANAFAPLVIDGEPTEVADCTPEEETLAVPVSLGAPTEEPAWTPDRLTVTLTTVVTITLLTEDVRDNPLGETFAVP